MKKYMLYETNGLLGAFIRRLQQENVNVIIDDNLMYALTDLQNVSKIIEIMRLFNEKYSSCILHKELFYSAYHNGNGAVICKFKLNMPPEEIKKIEEEINQKLDNQNNSIVRVMLVVD